MRTIPDMNLIKQIEERQKAEEEAKNAPKKRGRPKGRKDSYKRAGRQNPTLTDPATGLIVKNTASAPIINRMGDERVTAFVQYHVDMLRMRQGADKKNVPDLYQRFINYLQYCADHGIIPNNMNAYFAIGLDKDTIKNWYGGERGTPEQQQFARDIRTFFASVHEQAGGEGIVNPILSIYWSKAHDGMVEAQKLEVVNTDPLGEKKSAKEITEQYQDLLPEDT